jgi:tRNA (cytidine32/uridine32-2'-O)-methyltransferase
MFSNIRIVLVNTSLPANIGSAARALKTMGLRQLVLVDPKVFPSSEATALASGASDVLATARVVATLEEAIADCSLVIGASARSRTIPWPLLNAREAGELSSRIESEKHPVALVFGREDRGLTNEELHQCHYHVSIPSDEEYGVLNVASAVQVIAYEVRMAHLMAEKGVVAQIDYAFGSRAVG